MRSYVQPIGQHIAFPERFLLRDEAGRCFVWTGEDPSLGPEEIEPATADWCLGQYWLTPLVAAPWVHVDDLPLVPSSTRSGRP